MYSDIKEFKEIWVWISLQASATLQRNHNHHGNSCITVYWTLPCLQWQIRLPTVWVWCHLSKHKIRTLTHTFPPSVILRHLWITKFGQMMSWMMDSDLSCCGWISPDLIHGVSDITFPERPGRHTRTELLCWQRAPGTAKRTVISPWWVGILTTSLTHQSPKMKLILPTVCCLIYLTSPLLNVLSL